MQVIENATQLPQLRENVLANISPVGSPSGLAGPRRNPDITAPFWPCFPGAGSLLRQAVPSRAGCWPISGLRHLSSAQQEGESLFSGSHWLVLCLRLTPEPVTWPGVEVSWLDYTQIIRGGSASHKPQWSGARGF